MPIFGGESNNINEVVNNILEDPFKYKTLFFSIIIIVIIMIAAEFSTDSLKLVKIFQNKITKLIVIAFLLLIAFNGDIKTIIIVYVVTFIFYWIINGIPQKTENFNHIGGKLDYDNMKSTPKFMLNRSTPYNGVAGLISSSRSKLNEQNNISNDCKIEYKQDAKTVIENGLKNISNSDAKLDEQSLLGFNEIDNVEKINSDNKNQKEIFNQKFKNIFDARDFSEKYINDDRYKFVKHQLSDRNCDPACVNPRNTKEEIN